MTRRAWLWALGVASGVLGLVLLGIDQGIWDEGGPGIVGFELAGSEERAREIRAEWGPDGRDAARLSLWLDYLYLALYGAFWALAVTATRDYARRGSGNGTPRSALRWRGRPLAPRSPMRSRRASCCCRWAATAARRRRCWGRCS